VLSLNGEELQRKSFTPDTKQAIEFDISHYINQHKNDVFLPGAELVFELSMVTNSSESD